MSLLIQQQDSLFVESQSRNGQVQQVHYVVKNTPFHIKLSLVGSSALNFNTSVLSCTLCYDLPDRKEVEGVKGLPVDYLMHPSSDGKNCSVQVRIRVLSTQHHGSHFIIRFRLVERAVALEANSQPIKTTSKLDPIRRKIAEQSATTAGQVPPIVEVKTKTKRARSDQLLESLEEIKETQREQNRMLSSLFFNMAAMNPSSASPTISGYSNSCNSNPGSLEAALERLLVAYNSIDANERPYKLRNVVSSLPAYQEMLYEVGNVLSSPMSSPASTGYVTPLPVENSSPSLDSPSDAQSVRSSPADETQSYTTENSVDPALYLKELELWNSALHDILTQDDI